MIIHSSSNSNSSSIMMMVINHYHWCYAAANSEIIYFVQLLIFSNLHYFAIATCLYTFPFVFFSVVDPLYYTLLRSYIIFMMRNSKRKNKEKTKKTEEKMKLKMIVIFMIFTIIFSLVIVIVLSSCFRQNFYRLNFITI